MIVRTEAIPLRSLAYGETSQIVTLYTREMGTVAVLAKGARQSKSRFGSALQPMSYTQAVYYFKEGRELQTLSECSHLVPLNGIGRSLKKITVGLRIVELTRMLLPDPDPNPRAFNLLLQVLMQLDRAERRVGNLLLYFQLRLSSLLGFDPDFDGDTVRSLAPSGGLFVPATGVILPATASERGIQATRAALRAFAICSRADLDTVMRLELDPGQEAETAHLVESFVRYHVAEHYPRRAEGVIAQLFPDESPR